MQHHGHSCATCVAHSTSCQEAGAAVVWSCGCAAHAGAGGLATCSVRRQTRFGTSTTPRIFLVVVGGGGGKDKAEEKQGVHGVYTRAWRASGG
jgi:hypothetical protein